MSEDSRRPEAPPGTPGVERRVKFPLNKIAMGVFGMAVAIWLLATELRAVEVVPGEEPILDALMERGASVGTYVVVREPGEIVEIEGRSGSERLFLAPAVGLAIRTAPEGQAPEGAIAGRILTEDSRLILDVTRGRWTPKAVFALFLAAWGAVIIASALYLWRTLGSCAPSA